MNFGVNDGTGTLGEFLRLFVIYEVGAYAFVEEVEGLLLPRLCIQELHDVEQNEDGYITGIIFINMSIGYSYTAYSIYKLSSVSCIMSIYQKLSG